jgi:Pilus formation protein N terminal region
MTAKQLGSRCAYGYGVVFASFLAAAIPTIAFAEVVISNAPTRPIPPGEEPETCCNVDGRTVLTLGITSTLKFKKPFRTIAIGDAKVVDATADSDRTVTLHPVAYGETNIIFFDEDQVPIYTVGIVVSDPEKLGHVVRLRRGKPGGPGSDIPFGAPPHVYRCGDSGCELARGPPERAPDQIIEHRER